METLETDRLTANLELLEGRPGVWLEKTGYAFDPLESLSQIKSVKVRCPRCETKNYPRELRSCASLPSPMLISVRSQPSSTNLALDSVKILLFPASSVSSCSLRRLSASDDCFSTFAFLSTPRASFRDTTFLSRSKRPIPR